jgi:uncharacterized protein (DUF433 family)
MQARITIHPHIHFGKPCVTDTRIPVLSVLELVSEGVAFAEIVRDYFPDLAIEDIRACVRYSVLTTGGEEPRVLHTRCGG